MCKYERLKRLKQVSDRLIKEYAKATNETKKKALQKKIIENAIEAQIVKMTEKAL